MAAFFRYLFAAFRIAAAVCLVAVLSPLPDTPGASSSAFRTMLANLDGELSLVVWKSQFTVTLYKGSIPVKAYRAVFGRGYDGGDKERAGDKRTPEGEFYICTMNASKRFYKFMGISYPDLKHAEPAFRRRLIGTREYSRIERALAERKQPPWDTRLGGAVGIHGRMIDDAASLANLENWTDGCIALANADIDELFSIVSLGTPVTILP